MSEFVHRGAERVYPASIAVGDLARSSAVGPSQGSPVPDQFKAQRRLLGVYC